MSRKIWGFVAVLLLSCIAARAQGLFEFSAGVNAGTCKQDAEIPAAERNALNAGALAFVKAGLQQNGAQAYAMMTKDAQRSATTEQLGAVFGMLQKTVTSLDDPRIAHTYFIQNHGSGPDTQMRCGDLKDNNWVSVKIRPGADQGYVLISAKARNNDWVFTLWMMRDDDGWRVEDFNANISSIVGLTPEALLQKARTERDAGRLFNAALWYEAVETTASHGSTFRLGIAQTLGEDIEKFRLPSELQGNPPYNWVMQGAHYTVKQVNVIGVANQIGIMFLLPQTSWKDGGEADKFNRKFLTVFIATHPDYSRSFSFLVARALKPDNSGGFGTVFENGKGFDGSNTH